MIRKRENSVLVNTKLKKRKNELKSENKYEKKLQNFKNNLSNLNYENIFKNFLDILVETHFQKFVKD